ncbi:hypothetical protein EU803_06000 [Loktanella sp. IMCC34160]|uniref:hypothetical protein n=1 Tax=Loktanella sp. IMCC34160 TaxID=2510646 RepID=UPI00101C7A58|nr:hypothetical protein [Loktanella sp. IMCC34160]RYG92003.1 hypothetical protein EU803_06000 [Loktanella sp. IMCC34160]
MKELNDKIAEFQGVLRSYDNKVTALVAMGTIAVALFGKPAEFFDWAALFFFLSGLTCCGVVLVPRSRLNAFENSWPVISRLETPSAVISHFSNNPENAAAQLLSLAQIIRSKTRLLRGAMIFYSLAFVAKFFAFLTVAAQ